ncbi:hypothetical protein G5S52_08395 [Grimontia sp. S25]|uniref:Uncharacterized protein n=1 Tax=Grimontia sedimenti TaxID=2711294 RepID=A0A6M1RJ02_9GAMM|nr:DUF6339 family protein [Grimontia sedimenti]NGN97688.1 hypothetical protein [Grimontia sedimenti]
MALERLKYLSQDEHDRLIGNISTDREKYLNDSFSDLCDSYGWNSELKDILVDYSYLKSLDSTSTSSKLDVENSILVMKAFSDITPVMATDSRIWTRVCHAEGFEYTRNRWLNSLDKSNDENVDKAIRKHFFATHLTQYRDDNGIARLWWSSWIARRIDAENPRNVLSIIFSKADIRSNIIERSGITTRKCLITHLVDFIGENLDLSEKQFREFMKTVNLYGGGLVFEALSSADIKSFLLRCLILSKENA